MSVPQETRSSAALARVYWMLLGPMALALAAFSIVKAGPGWLNPADIAYFALLAAVLAARCLEFRAGSPQTAEGEPATPADLRRYLIATSVIGLAIWVFLNLLANLWLA